MTGTIVNDTNTDFDVDQIAVKLRVAKGGPQLIDRFNRLADDVRRIARPKGAYKPVDFDILGDDVVVIDEIRLTSRVLSVQLDGLHRVFPFVATCGQEISDWSLEKTDMLERYWLEAMLDAMLLNAITATGKHMADAYGLGKTAVLTPGSIDDWPLQEQKPLFSILGDVATKIGIRLMDSYMMSPRQSISGIVFPTEIDFQTCMLCARKKCPKRRAAYDPELFDQRFKKK